MAGARPGAAAPRSRDARYGLLTLVFLDQERRKAALEAARARVRRGFEGEADIEIAFDLSFAATSSTKAQRFRRRSRHREQPHYASRGPDCSSARAGASRSRSATRGGTRSIRRPLAPRASTSVPTRAPWPNTSGTAAQRAGRSTGSRPPPPRASSARAAAMHAERVSVRV